MSDIAKKQNVRDLVLMGKAAQKHLSGFSRKQLENIFTSMLEKCRRNSQRLARLSAGETGVGNLHSKLARHRFVFDNITAAMRDVKADGIVAHYPEFEVYEVAVPLGLIVAVVPYYAPVATTMAKALLAMRSRNTVVFVAPPGAIRCVRETVRVLQGAANEAGAPEGCILCADDANVSFDELISQPEVDFILATSTDEVTLAAHRSGKPNISVGESNTPVYIDSSASIAHAVRCILSSQEFDFAMSCGAEEVLCVHKAVYREVLAEFEKQGAYLASVDEIAKISPLLKLKLVRGKPARDIARIAGFRVPPETPVLLIPCEKFTQDLFFRSKSAPLLPVVKVTNWEDACVVCLKTLSEAGAGHSVIAHTTDPDIIMEFVAQMPAARILINAPGTQGAMGMATGLNPSLTLGAGTRGRCITSDNISLVHFLQRKRVSTLLENSPLWHRELHTLDISASSPRQTTEKTPSPWSIASLAPLLGQKSPLRAAKGSSDPCKAAFSCIDKGKPAPWSRSTPPPPIFDLHNHTWPRKIN